jgi:hypothetical protein
VKSDPRGAGSLSVLDTAKGVTQEYGATKINTPTFEIAIVSIRAPRESFSWALL